MQDNEPGIVPHSLGNRLHVFVSRSLITDQSGVDVRKPPMCASDHEKPLRKKVAASL